MEEFKVLALIANWNHLKEINPTSYQSKFRLTVGYNMGCLYIQAGYDSFFESQSSKVVKHARWLYTTPPLLGHVHVIFLQNIFTNSVETEWILISRLIRIQMEINKF